MATGRLSNGTTNTVQVTWSVSGGGTITSGGLFTAGGTAGQYKVFAQLVGGTLKDTADVFVTTTPPPSSNEPAGYTPFAIHQPERHPGLRPGGGRGAGQLVRLPTGRREQSEDRHRSDRSPEPRFGDSDPLPQGQVGGVGPADWGGWDVAGSGPAGEKSKVYFSVWIKIQGPDYENHPSGTKFGFLAYGHPSSSGQSQGFFLLQNGTGAQTVQTDFAVLFLQQGIPQPNGQVTRNLNPNVSRQHLMTAGSWHHWEAVLELNTQGRQMVSSKCGLTASRHTTTPTSRT